MCKFLVHKNAIENLNKKALSIVGRVSSVRIEEESTTKTEGDDASNGPGSAPSGSGFSPDLHVSGAITESDFIGEPRIGKSDLFGNIVSQEWRDKNEKHEIYPELYIEIKILAGQLLKHKEIGPFISIGMTEQIICDWVRQYHSKKTKHSFFDFFRAEAKSMVRGIQIWTPIHGLCIEKPFRVGHVAFVPIYKKLIDDWKIEWAKKINGLPISEEEKKSRIDGINEYMEDKIRKMQGYTAAVMTLNAEPDKANDVLLREANKALSLVRIFTEASLIPQATSPYVLWGIGHLDKSFTFIVKDRSIDMITDSIIWPTHIPPSLISDIIDEAFKIGLGRLHEILISDNRSDLEDYVLEACLLYSRCTIAKEPADKLIYLMVSLESILIKDSNEPISQNLSDRMAFLFDETPKRRKYIAKVIREAYKLRSKFMHHGDSIESMDSLKEIMNLAWHAIRVLIALTGEMKTREELFDWLENRRLS